MRFTSVIVSLLSVGSASAFVAPKINPSVSTTGTQLQATQNDNLFGKALATAAMTAFLWSSPSLVAEQASTLQAANQHTPSIVSTFTDSFSASAKDKASATGSRVNKDPESLLRYGLPINNKEVRTNILSDVAGRTCHYVCNH